MVSSNTCSKLWTVQSLKFCCSNTVGIIYFKVWDETKPLYNHKSKVFHNLVEICLNLYKRSIQDKGVLIYFLTTCVMCIYWDYWINLVRYMRYIRLTMNFSFILGVDETNVLKWFINSSHTVYQDCNRHIYGIINLEK